MTIVNLLSLPSIDINYENMINFKSISARDTFFQNKVGLSVKVNMKADSNRTELSLNKSIDEINNYDYLYFADNEGKKYFYFITDLEVINPTNCKLTVMIDVFTTYQFDFQFLDCFVDRCHQDRWDGDSPIENLVDEGFPLGEYIQESVEDLYEYNNGLIITSSAPLGKMDYTRNTSGGGGGTAN